MRKLLLQLDSSPHPSVFDRVVAFDGGADEVMSYGGVAEDAVRDLVHGAIFTRGPKDQRHTAIFIGGPAMSGGGGQEEAEVGKGEKWRQSGGAAGVQLVPHRAWAAAGLRAAADVNAVPPSG